MAHDFEHRADTLFIDVLIPAEKILCVVYNCEMAIRLLASPSIIGGWGVICSHATHIKLKNGG